MAPCTWKTLKNNTSTLKLTTTDTFVYINDKRKLQATLYTKPTEIQKCLHFQSVHPKHQIDSLPYSQAL